MADDTRVGGIVGDLTFDLSQGMAQIQTMLEKLGLYKKTVQQTEKETHTAGEQTSQSLGKMATSAEKGAGKAGKAIKGMGKDIQAAADTIENESNQAGRALDRMGDEAERTLRRYRTVQRDIMRTGQSMNRENFVSGFSSGAATARLRSPALTARGGSVTPAALALASPLAATASVVSQGNAITKTAEQIEKGVQKTEAAVKKAGTAVSNLGMASTVLRRELTSLRALGGAGLMGLGGGMGMIGGLSGIGLAGFGVKIASDIETGFVGVKRTTGMVGEQFQALREEILKLSGTLKGIDLSGFQKVVQIGGLLGIRGVENLRNFTETTIKAAMAMDMADEEAANYLARITQNMNRPLGEMENLANAANHLGNNTKATAAEILEITLRMSQMANLAGLTVSETVALATATRDMGTNLEVGGSAWNNILQRMISNIDGFAKAAGMPLKEFEELVKNHPMKAIQAFSLGLSKLNKIDRIKALDALQVDGVRVAPVIAGLANNLDRLNEILDLSNNEYETGSSVQREYEASASTLSAEMTRLWNSIKLLADTMGGPLLSDMTAFTGAIADGIKWLAGYGETTADVTQKLIDQHKELVNAKDEFDQLAQKQERSKEEQDKLNQLAEQLLKIYPSLTFKYKENGDVIGYMSEQYRDLIALKKQDIYLSRQQELEEINKEIAEKQKERDLVFDPSIEKERERLEKLKKKREELAQKYESNKEAGPGLEITNLQIAHSENIIRSHENKVRGIRKRLDELQKRSDSLRQNMWESLGVKTPRMIEEENQKKDAPPNPPPPDEDYDDDGGGKSISDEAALRQRLALMRIEDDAQRRIAALRQEADTLKQEFPALAQEIEAAYAVPIAKEQRGIEDARRKTAEDTARAIAGAERLVAEQRKETVQSSMDLTRRDIEQRRDSALAVAETTQQQIDVERDYLEQMQNLQAQELQAATAAIQQQGEEKRKALQEDRDAALKIAADKASVQQAFREKELELNSLYDQLLYNLELRGNQDLLDLEMEYQEKKTRILEEAARRDRELQEQANREAERLMRERERTFRRVFEPLFSGGDVRDKLKALFKEDLMDFLAGNMPFSLPLGDQKGGVFNLLLPSFNPTPQDESQKAIEANTRKTAEAAKETNKGISNLPLNMGNILGAVIGFGLSGGRVTGGSILQTFALSLAGGFASNFLQGPNLLTAPLTPMPVEAPMVVPALAKTYYEPTAVPLPAASAPVVHLTIDNRGGTLDRAAVQELKDTVRTSVDQRLAELNRKGSALVKR
jgi:TP901 family phage tail tape measure protein